MTRVIFVIIFPFDIGSSVRFVINVLYTEQDVPYSRRKDTGHNPFPSGETERPEPRKDHLGGYLVHNKVSVTTLAGIVTSTSSSRASKTLRSSLRSGRRIPDRGRSFRSFRGDTGGDRPPTRTVSNSQSRTPPQ